MTPPPASQLCKAAFTGSVLAAGSFVYLEPTKISVAAAATACAYEGVEVAADVAFSCKDVNNKCITDALQRHKQAIAACLK
jgi:hypothetical protein